ncbi:hypothetical protein M493_15000 [Geobacillus genomosp. 3]|uniref:Uncharacterized protein n=1 Tax=Geobacillus genomosp. 3 TaxID=1921421 RepID=S5Z8U7_GEOG3|nr:hypothetical protein M493_15000 [Geobacillus genomosp. 3]
MELFFDNINGNILLRCMVNKLDETMPFLRLGKIKPVEKSWLDSTILYT